MADAAAGAGSVGRPSPEAEGRRQDALDIGAAAATLIRSRFGEPGPVVGKALTRDGSRWWDLVTEVDHASERLVRELVAELSPGALVLGEEDGLVGADGSPADVDDAKAADELWIVDPIDGTVNFAHGIPHCCVSIACWRRGRPLAGAILDPLVQEAFSFAAGDDGEPAVAIHRTHMGAERVMAVDPEVGAGESIVCMGGGAAADAELRDQVRGWRRIGSAALALAWVAAGRLGAYVQLGNLSPWDHAVGVPLVQAAGGIVRDSDLGEWTGSLGERTGVVAASAGVFADLEPALSRHVGD